MRHCPICLQESIIGHGRRRKQAHDEDHDWIEIRRGLCNLCGKTFTFLPPFSLPYCHYSLIARSQALRRYFVENRGWEAAASDRQRSRTGGRRLNAAPMVSKPGLLATAIFVSASGHSCRKHALGEAGVFTKLRCGCAGKLRLPV